MIQSFADRETELVYNQEFSRRLPNAIQMMIDNAKSLNDLRVPPNNRLEALHGDREGQYSIRINDQWRICFSMNEGLFYNVEIVDYH